MPQLIWSCQLVVAIIKDGDKAACTRLVAGEDLTGGAENGAAIPALVIRTATEPELVARASDEIGKLRRAIENRLW